MPIVFEDVTGEVAPEHGGASADAGAPATDSPEDLREKIMCELALLRERQARLFAD